MNAPPRRIRTQLRRGRRPPSAHDLYEQATRVGDEVGALTSATQRAVTVCRALVRDRLERQPYATLALAAAAGYVLGGGMPLGAVRMLLGIGARLAAERAMIHLAVSD